jgi:SAM-dependent methyltransferase
MACSRCGFVQQHPMPTSAEIDAMYAEEASYCADLERGAELFLERDRQVLAELAGRGAAGPLLDIGAGAGFLLRAALERGWEAVGIEPSQPSREHIRARLTATLYDCDVQDAPIEPESMGAVTLSHSLEHVRDPVGTLRRVREVLRPGGMVFVAVPNWRAGTRVLLDGQISWVAACHISYFERGSLESAFRAAGLEPVAFETRPFLGVNYPLAIDFARRLHLERPAQRFLGLGQHPLAELIGNDLQLPCPPWRFRLVVRAAHALLNLWPESLCVRLGRGQELRGVARRAV